MEEPPEVKTEEKKEIEETVNSQVTQKRDARPPKRFVLFTSLRGNESLCQHFPR